MRLLLIVLAMLLACFGVHGEPVLTIAATNLDAPEISFRNTSARIVVDGTNVYVGPEGCGITQQVVCGCALRVSFTNAEGTTNEIETSGDLTNWTPANIWFVMRDKPISYFEPVPTMGARFFRVIQR